MTTTTIDDESEAGVCSWEGMARRFKRRFAVAGVPLLHYGRRAEERSNEAFV
jgi:hypothetical protein